MDKIKDRLNEITTWVVGIPALIFGFMTLLDADKAQEVSKVVSDNGEAIASGDYTTGLIGIGLGIVGIFAKEK